MYEVRESPAFLDIRLVDIRIGIERGKTYIAQSNIRGRDKHIVELEDQRYHLLIALGKEIVDHKYPQEKHIEGEGSSTEGRLVYEDTIMYSDGMLMSKWRRAGSRYSIHVDGYLDKILIVEGILRCETSH